MREISMTTYSKSGRKWVETYKTTDKAYVYECLARDVCNKKIHKADYIRQIKNQCNYDGTRTYTVTYDNNVKTDYIVKD